MDAGDFTVEEVCWRQMGVGPAFRMVKVSSEQVSCAGENGGHPEGGKLENIKLRYLLTSKN